MTPIDPTSRLFRLAYLALAVILVGVAATSLYRFASSPTDENRFATAPGNIYVTAAFPGTILTDARDAIPETDSVRVGDLLVAINGTDFNTIAKIDKFLARGDSASQFDITVFRPSEDRSYTFLADRGAVPDSAFRTIPSAVYVAEVTPGGASDQAGLKVGDLIYRINNQNFKDASEADRILRFALVGKSLQYDVLRDNEQLSMEVTLAKAGIQLILLMFILVGLSFMSVGIFVAVRRPQFMGSRLMGLAFLTVGFIMIASARRDIRYDMFAMARDVLVTGAMFFAFPLWLHMAHYFPVSRDELLARSWIRYGAYVIATIFTVLTIVSIATGWKGGDWSLLGIILSMVWVGLVSLLYYRKRSAQYRNMIRIIHRTGIALIAVTVIYTIIRIYIADAPRVSPNLADALMMGLVVLMPLAHLYTIGHYRLFDLDLRVRRNIQYSFISIIWMLIALGGFGYVLATLTTMEVDWPNVQFSGTFVEISEAPMNADHRRVTDKTFVLLLGLILAWAGLRFHRLAQRFIDRKFYRSHYDYRRATSEITEVMATQITLLGLARGVVDKLAELMQLKRCGVIFLRNETECCCKEAVGVEEAEWKTFCSTVMASLVGLIQRNRSDHRFSVEYLPADLRPHFQRLNWQHIMAIRTKDKLVGILMFGEMRSESPYTKDDLAFLSGTAKQAAVAIENAFLYDELAEQDRLRYELEIARRIQLASLPQTTPQISGLDIAGISIPAHEVGGDYFDYLNGVPEELTVIVGDVSGKGTSAALYMSKIQGIMRSLHDFGLSPRELFIRANQLLLEGLEKSSFITATGAAFYAHTRRLVFARAGHMPVYRFNTTSGAIETLQPRGIGLGLANSETFAKELEECALEYRPGDVFVFITDGITEALSPEGIEFGEENLLKILAESNGASAKRIRDQIVTAVNHFAENARQHDDVTVVVVKAV